MKVNRKLLLLPLALVLVLSACGESKELEEKTALLEEKVNALEKEKGYTDEEWLEYDQGSGYLLEEENAPEEEKPLAQVVLTKMDQLNQILYEDAGYTFGVLEFDIVDDIPVFTFSQEKN